MTFMLVINVKQLNFSNGVIGIMSLERLFSKFYRRHHEFVSKFSVGLKYILHQGLSEPEFYCALASRGYDSVIRNMKSLVCSGIDSMCVFSTFALELEDK